MRYQTQLEYRTRLPIEETKHDCEKELHETEQRAAG